MNRSLKTVHAIDNVVDKKHVYHRALDIGDMNDVQLSECVQFAESNGLYSLAFRARQRIQDF